MVSECETAELSLSGAMTVVWPISFIACCRAKIPGLWIPSSLVISIVVIIVRILPLFPVLQYSRKTVPGDSVYFF